MYSKEEETTSLSSPHVEVDVVASPPSGLMKRMHRNTRSRTDGGEGSSSSNNAAVAIPRVLVPTAEEAFDRLSNLPEGVARLYYSVNNESKAKAFVDKIIYYATTRYMSETHGVLGYQKKSANVNGAFYAIVFAYPKTYPSIRRRVATPSEEEWNQIGEGAIVNAFPEVQHHPESGSSGGDQAR